MKNYTWDFIIQKYLELFDEIQFKNIMLEKKIVSFFKEILLFL